MPDRNEKHRKDNESQGEYIARRTAANTEERARKSNEWNARKDAKIMAAQLDCLPSSPCPTCAEELWIVESFSPNRKSVTWICDYCKKKMIVKRGEFSKRTVHDREPIPKHVQREVWRRDQGRCVNCESNEKLEYDHIIPVSKGGANTTRNVQLLCESCNRSKSDKI